MNNKKKIITTLLLLITVFVTSVLGGCGAKKDSADGSAEVANPMVEYKSKDAMEKELDFAVMGLSDDLGYKANSFYIIDETLAEITYDDNNGNTITLRTSVGSEDNSGIQGVTNVTDEDHAGINVHVGTMEDYRVAWFTGGKYVYSISAQNMNEETFATLMKDVTGA